MTGATRAELFPNRHRRGYWTPGNYWRFRDSFARRPLEGNRAELAELEQHRPRVGIAWPRSNYFRALEDVTREQTSAHEAETAAGPNPAQTKGNGYVCPSC